MVHNEREKRIDFPRKEKVRDIICNDIDEILQNNPKNFGDFLFQLQQNGYEIKRGKHIALKSKSQKRFVRLSSLPDGYKDEDIYAMLTGKREAIVQNQPKKNDKHYQQRSFNLLIDIQDKLRNKGPGYQRWATVYNLKQMSKTLLFLRDHDIQSIEQLNEMVSKNIERRDQLFASIQDKEKQLNRITKLKIDIINYSKTRETYEAYRKSGYNKKFLEEKR